MDFILIVIAFACIIFILRMFGAWALRINEIINNQLNIIEELKKLNSK